VIFQKPAESIEPHSGSPHSGRHWWRRFSQTCEPLAKADRLLWFPQIVLILILILILFLIFITLSLPRLLPSSKKLY